jgi:hypothetical protein
LVLLDQIKVSFASPRRTNQEFPRFPPIFPRSFQRECIARQGAAASKGFIGPDVFGLTMIIIGLLALLLAVLDHRWAMQTRKNC